jgi:primosomal protein N''
MSIIRRLASEALAKAEMPDPTQSNSLESYAMALAWSGVDEREGRQLLAAAAARLEAQRATEYASREQVRRATEAREQRAAGCEAAVARWWAILGWAEQGSPDGSGPLFTLNVNSTPLYPDRPRSPLDID